MKFLISCLFFYSLYGFSQTVHIKPGDPIETPTPYVPTPVATITAAPTLEPTPIKEQTWAEKVYNGANAGPEKSTENTESKPSDPEKEIENMAADLKSLEAELKSSPTALFTNPELSKKMIKVLGGKGKNGEGFKGPFASMTDEGMRRLILENVKGSKLSEYITPDSKLMSFIVKFLKSDEAFLGLLKIPQNEKKSKMYFATFVGLILLSFLLNLMGSKNSPFWKRLLRKLAITGIIMCCQFGALYFFFSEELGPTIEIFKSVFLT